MAELLELAICRQLTRLMGGEVRVERTPGRGSRFALEARRHLPIDHTQGRGGNLDAGRAALAGAEAQFADLVAELKRLQQSP